MENNTLELKYKKRQTLTKEGKFFNYIYSLLLFTISFIAILKGFRNQGIYFAYFFIGLIPIIKNIGGKEWHFTRHSLKVNQHRIVIEISRFDKIIIDLNNVEQISILTSGLRVGFVDAVRFIDLSWLEYDQFQILGTKLLELSKLHNFKLY